MSGKCPAEQYHSVCKIVTEGFQDVSQEIQDVEKNVNESDKVIGGMIRQLQNVEKERLEKVTLAAWKGNGSLGIDTIP